MKTIKLDGQIDQDHVLHAPVPADLPPGAIQFVMLVPEDSEDEFSEDWMKGGRVWAAELSDPREDIYTMTGNARWRKHVYSTRTP